MAIVFISPKKKQTLFFRGIILSLVLFLSIVSFIVLLPEFFNKNQNVPVDLSSGDQGIAINFNFLDSDRVKNLEPFVVSQAEFSYIVKDKDGKQVAGNISAHSKQEAKTLLENSEFTIINLQEMNAGKSNPFAAY
jgi:uncharacterized membrane protein YkgB